jgi:hypothetical protein
MIGHLDVIALARAGREMMDTRTGSGLPLSPAAARALWLAGTRRTLALLAPLAGRTLIMADTPRPPRDVPRCVADNLSDPAACNFARAAAIHPDRVLLSIEAGPARQASAGFVDVSAFTCPTSPCAAVTDGGLISYVDDDHLSRTFSRSIAFLIGQAIDRASSDPPVA